MMNRRTLSTMLAACGLLLFVAGCVIQVRPDGGLRIDLPPMLPVTLIANGPQPSASPITATATLTGTPVLTNTVTPTATLPTTATPTLIATAPTAVTPITATVTATATAPVTATSTVTATPIMTTTGTPVVTPTSALTATRTLTAPTGTPVSGTAVTSTPPPGTPSGTRTALPPSATPMPTTTATRSATTTPTRSATGTPIGTVTGTPTGSATGTVTPGTPTPATPPVTPTPIPGTVFLSNHRGYVADGAYYVVGEVVNGERFPVFNAKVIASFYDANNNLVGAQESVALLVRIDTELSSPFKLSIPDPGNIDHYELTLVWDDISIINSQELTILSQETRTDGQLEVFGELRNDGSVTVSNVVVVVTFYDESGAVVDVYQGTVSKPEVARDETATYTITIPNAELEYDHFTVQAQGTLTLY